MACSVLSVPGATAVGHEMPPCVSPPPSCTDRPRCYALMREDYLWSPLQSACSMQHLRSVPSLGRQVLALRPHSHTLVPAQPNTRSLNNTVLLLTPTALHAIPSRAGNLSTVLVLYCHLVPQVLTHIMQISHESHSNHTLLLGVHVAFMNGG